jgi:DNA-binding HxlR family transcriptional regulator
VWQRDKRIGSHDLGESHLGRGFFSWRGILSRAGVEALSLLAAPLNVHTLRALQQGPLELAELHHAIGSPPPSTVRLYTRRLQELELLETFRRREFPTKAEYRLTEAGHSLLKVAAFLQAWLDEAPDKPTPLDSIAGKSRTKALIGGWSSSIVRAVAARPLSLTELNMLIPRVSYPSLHRKLRAMWDANLVERQAGYRDIPYKATAWLRRAVVPLTSAVAWELQVFQQPPAAISPIDIEAAFMLAIPVMSLDPRITGRCRLAVEVRRGGSPASAGVLVGIEKGRVVSCSSNLAGDTHVSISGSPVAWLRQMNGGPRGELEIDGNRALATKVTDALRTIPGSPQADGR